MFLRRSRYQAGWIERRKRKSGPAVWVFRYWETTANGQHEKRSAILGDVKQFPRKDDAKRAAESFRISINAPRPGAPVTLGAVADRYLREQLPARASTAYAYRHNVEHYIKPRWGEFLLAHIKPLAVEEWLKELPLAPKTRGHVRSLLHLLFNWAMRWELFPLEKNPISLVRVKGCSKRIREPRVLTAEEFRAVLFRLQEPVRTMACVAACLGLRASEMVGLQWSDVDWERLRVKVARSWVRGRVEETKTDSSRGWLPLDPDLGELLLQHKARARFKAADSPWVFAGEWTGTPRWPWGIQRNILGPVGEAAGVGRIGWHSLRHTYSSLLHEHGTDLKVQQELLRHSDVRTTLNIYTQAVSSAKRAANSKVVQLLLREKAG
jgi:integrase